VTPDLRIMEEWQDPGLEALDAERATALGCWRAHRDRCGACRSGDPRVSPCPHGITLWRSVMHCSLLLASRVPWLRLDRMHAQAVGG